MFDLTEDIKPVAYVKSHTAEILKQVEEKNVPVVITQNGEARAVLMAAKYYQSLIDSINLLKIISIGENDIKNGRFVTHSDLDKKINSILEG
jgi:prevent-host-death family protein